jgi:hypothetical protein
MAKHTAGPWVKDYGGTTGHIKAIVDVDGKKTPTVCKYDLGTHGCAPTLSGQEIEANGNLLAAAPEMLAALRGFVKAWSEGTFLLNGYDQLKACRDAIQKAEGLPQSVESF